MCNLYSFIVKKKQKKTFISTTLLTLYIFIIWLHLTCFFTQLGNSGLTENAPKTPRNDKGQVVQHMSVMLNQVY